MAGERFYRVDGTRATPLVPIALSDAGLAERSHLQEWVIAHPEILGDGVKIVAVDVDRWQSPVGPGGPDCVDILGLDRSGRIIVAELGSEAAPDTIDLRAVKYAAMASRFTADALVAQHADFLRLRGAPVSEADARAALFTHCAYGLSAQTLAKPRIVVMAGSFPPGVTATTVWLTEMSIDITLLTFQAYSAEGVITFGVSQLYPVPDVEAFTVGPVSLAEVPTPETEALPHVAWTGEDLARLRNAASTTVLAILDLCSETPGVWIGLQAVEDRAGRTNAQARQDLSVLTTTVKRHLGRSNWPFEAQFGIGGEQQAYYRVTAEVAQIWRNLAGSRSSGAVAESSRSQARGPFTLVESSEVAPRVTRE